MSRFITIDGCYFLPADLLVAMVAYHYEEKGSYILLYHTIPGMTNPLKLSSKDEKSSIDKFERLQEAMRRVQNVYVQKKMQ